MAVPEEILNIGALTGQNHFNVGIGRASGHVDHSLSEIAAGFAADPEFVAVDGGTWCRFSVRMDAKTTSSHTKYPRSELRELDEAGGKAAWDGRTGVHRMAGTSRIVHLPPRKPWAVFCQIHDANSDLVRVQTEGRSVSELKIVARNTPPGADDEVVTTVMPSYTLGEEIAWRLEVTDGAGELFLNDALVLTFPAGAQGCYFKAGCYAQSNTKDEGEDPSEFAAIDIKTDTLRQWHTGWAQPEHATPGAAAARQFSVAFASCLKANDSAAFDRITALEPDYFAMLGDCWYEEDDHSRDHQERWKSKFSAPKYAAMLAALPNPQIVGWSDHDFGFGSNVAGAASATVANTANAAYRATFPQLLPDLPAEGIYRTWVRDRVRFILCDERTFKSANSATDDAHKTVLGEVQKAWLKGLLAAPATPVVVIFGDTPWIGPRTPGDDGWKGYTTERAELATAFERSPAAIIRCNGDMHCLAFTHDHLGVDRVWQAAPLSNKTKVKDGDGEYLGTFPAHADEGPAMEAFGVMTFADDGETLVISCEFFGTPEQPGPRLRDSLVVTGGGEGTGGLGAVALAPLATHPGGGPVRPALPTDARPGDLVLAHLHSRYGEAVTCSDPTWQLVASHVGTDSSFAGAINVYAHRVAEGDSAPTYSSNNADGGLVGKCSAWGGAEVGPSAVARSTTLPVVAPAVHTTLPGSKVVYLIAQDNDYTLSVSSGDAELLYAHRTVGGPDGDDGAAIAAAVTTVHQPGDAGVCRFGSVGQGNPRRWVAATLVLHPGAGTPDAT